MERKKVFGEDIRKRIGEVKFLERDAAWYASFEDSKQGKALMYCQIQKIKQLKDLIKTIEFEIELAEDPKEYSAEIILQSIKAMIQNLPEIEVTEGYFTWKG